jgi:hypothetical protein
VRPAALLIFARGTAPAEPSLGMKSLPRFAMPGRSTRLSNKINLTVSTSQLIWTAQVE